MTASPRHRLVARDRTPLRKILRRGLLFTCLETDTNGTQSPKQIPELTLNTRTKTVYTIYNIYTFNLHHLQTTIYTGGSGGSSTSSPRQPPRPRLASVITDTPTSGKPGDENQTFAPAPTVLYTFSKFPSTLWQRAKGRKANNTPEGVLLPYGAIRPTLLRFLSILFKH